MAKITPRGDMQIFWRGVDLTQHHTFLGEIILYVLKKLAPNQNLSRPEKQLRVRGIILKAQFPTQTKIMNITTNMNLPTNKPLLTTRWLASLTLLALLFALPPGARAQYLLNSANNTTIKNFVFSMTNGWSGTLNPPSGGSAGTTITISESGTQFVTNDYTGNFQLNLLQKNTGVWTVSAMNGSVLEFVANGSTAPEIYDNQTGSGNLFTITAPLQFDNDAIVTNDSAGTITFSNGVSGTAGLIFNGTNTLTLAGSVANTYGGTTTINGGKLLLNSSAVNGAIPGNMTIGGGTAQAILQLSASTQIADTSILTFGANGIFRLNGQFDTIGGIASTSGNGLIENSNATSRTLTLQLTNANQTFSGIIQNGAGAGILAITKTGPNAQILTGVNTYTGGTIVSAGALTLSGSGSINSSTSVSVASNATFNVLSSGFTVSLGHKLTGAGTVAGGLVTLASGGILNPGDNATAGTMAINNGLTLSGGETNNYYFDTVQGTNDLIIVNPSGGLTVNGGVFNLYLTNSTTPFSTLGTYNLIQYSGSIGGTGLDSTWTTVSANNPHIANPQAGLVYSFGTAGIYLQVTIGISASTVFWNVDASASWNNTADWTTATIPNAAGATASLGGGGTPTTAFRNVTLDGNQIIGSLNLNSANSFEVDQGSSGTLTLNNSANTAQINVLAGTSNVVTAPIALVAGVTVNASSSTAVALNGNISGTGGLTNSSLGTLALGGTDTYTVGTIQNSGTLALNSAGALGSAPLTINGGTLDNTSGTNVTLAGNPAQTWNAGFFFNGSTNLNLGSGAVSMTPATMAINVVSNTLTVGGPLSGTNLTKNGNGTLTLGGANNYSGVTTVGAGTLNLTGVSTITNAVTVNGTGTLSLNAAGGALPNGSTISMTAVGASLNVAQNDTIGTINFAAGNAYGAGTLTVTNSIAPNIGINLSNLISCSLAGTAQFKKTGQGMTLLGAVNSYTGGTLVDGANSYLKITNSGTLGSTSGTLNVDTASAIVDLGGSSQTVGPVLIGGIITNGTLTGSSFTVTNGVVYATLVGSGAALTKSGPSNAILASANSYTGATTISAGTLQVDGSTASGSAVALNAGTLSGTGTVGGSVTEASGASIAPGDNNVGTLTITGNLTLNGGGTLNIAATNTGNFSKLNVHGTLNASGVTTIILPAAALPNGNYNLAGVYGAVNGNAANFSVTSVSPRTYQIAIIPGVPNIIQLQVTTPTLLTWIGDGINDNWNFTDTADWGNPPPTTAVYADGDSVLFDDTSVNPTVNLQGTLSPLAVTVSNTINSYVFNDGGSGNISGAATLSKQGTNTLTINTANTYTGVTTISGGTVSIGADNALGTPPGTPTPGQLVINGGMLASDSLSVDPNRGIALGPQVGSGSGTIDTLTSGSISIPGVIGNNLTGRGSLIAGVLGSGTITLSGANTYTGGTSITNGILELANDQSAANGGFYVGLHNDYNCYLRVDVGANVAVAAGNTLQVGPANTATAGITATSYLLDYGTITNSGTFLAGRVSNATIESGGLLVQNGPMTVQAYGNLAASMTIAGGGTCIYTGTNAIQLNGSGTTFGAKATLTISGTFITGQGFTNSVIQSSGNAYGQVTFGSGSVLQLTASVPNLFVPTTNTYGGVHCVLNAGAAPTIDTQGFVATNYANITGNGGLTKIGSGELVMAVTNAYVGNTTVNAGTLAIQQPTLNTNSTISVTNGGVLELDFAATNTVAALVLNGTNQPGGVYNSSTPGGLISGTGSLLVPTAPSTVVTLTNSISGGVLTLTWPTAEQSWYVQSNSVDLSNPNDWFDVPNSQNGTSLNITIDPTQTKVFYRLSSQP